MEALAIVGGTLIDGTGRLPIRDSVILIAGERVVNVGRRDDLILPDGISRVDATGRTIVPGLIDAHSHPGPVAANTDFPTEDPESLTDWFMRRFVEYGITTVRCTGMPEAGPTFRMLKRGKVGWPRFFGSGPNLDGPPGGPWPGLIVVRSPEEARDRTRSLIDAGVDFLKTYVWMSADLQRTVVKTAHERGVAVATHVGHVITVEEAILAGVDALEHVRVGRELVPEEHRPELDAIKSREHDYLMSFLPWRYIDPASDRAGRLIGLMVERGVFLTPTLSLAVTVTRGDEPEGTRPEGMEEMPAVIREIWSRDTIPVDWTEDDFRWGKIELARQMAFVGRAHEAGVRIAAGTDTPNPFVIPGKSLHGELQLLVECGLRPMDALVAATGRAAELLGQQNTLGTVEKGKLADLVILDNDPLQDIRNTLSISSVMMSGEAISGQASSS